MSIISAKDIVEKIKKIKEEFWDNIVSKIRSITIDFASENDMILISPPTNTFLEYATFDSYHKVKNLINKFLDEINEELIPETHYGITFFAKRVSDNVFVIRIDPTDFKIRIINFFYSFNILKNFSRNILGNNELMLYFIVHKLCFPENFNFINEEKEQYKLFDILFSKLEKHKYINKKYQNPHNAKDENAMSQFFTWCRSKNILIIDSSIVISLKHPNELRTEIIQLFGKQTIVSFFKPDDFDLSNGYLEIIFKKSGSIVRIFNGYGYCYQQDKYGKVTFIVALKYALLNKILFNDTRFLNLLLYQKYQYIFSSARCIGETISQYKIYYMKQWGNSPFQFIKRLEKNTK